MAVPCSLIAPALGEPSLDENAVLAGLGSNVTRSISSKLSWPGPDETAPSRQGPRLRDQSLGPSRLASQEDWDPLSRGSVILDIPAAAVISRYEQRDVCMGSPGVCHTGFSPSHPVIGASLVTYCLRQDREIRKVSEERALGENTVCICIHPSDWLPGHG